MSHPSDVPSDSSPSDKETKEVNTSQELQQRRDELDEDLLRAEMRAGAAGRTLARSIGDGFSFGVAKRIAEKAVDHVDDAWDYMRDFWDELG